MCSSDLDFYPRACHLAAPWEKGKVERAGVRYVRQNFWPLRQFSDFSDVNRQARQWLHEVESLLVESCGEFPCNVLLKIMHHGSINL